MNTITLNHSTPLPFSGKSPSPSPQQQERFQNFLEQNADRALDIAEKIMSGNIYNNTRNTPEYQMAMLILDKFFPSAKVPRQGSNLSLLA
ncbi:MAG: hypothetical protein K2X66_08495 [Cyanobacteria bacterium]|nr:hypothetical protein [Cyanobacteriota bacterium]